MLTNACSQKRKCQSELVAALQRAWSHLGMSCFLCGWCSVSRLPLIKEECLSSHSSYLKAYIDAFKLFQLAKSSHYKMFIQTFLMLRFYTTCGNTTCDNYPSTLTCFWRCTVEALPKTVLSDIKLVSGFVQGQAKEN